MVEAIFRYLARALASILERFADPELDKKLRAFNEKVAAVEARAKEAELEAQKSEAQYLKSAREREQWDKLNAEVTTQIQESESRLRAVQDRLAAREDEIKKINQAVLDRSDDDAFSGGVPKSNASN